MLFLQRSKYLVVIDVCAGNAKQVTKVCVMTVVAVVMMGLNVPRVRTVLVQKQAGLQPDAMSLYPVL